MKVSRILWCTSEADAALTFLRVSVKPVDEYNIPKALTMNSVGEPTSECYSWRLPKDEHISKLTVYNAGDRVSAVRFETFKNNQQQMGTINPTKSGKVLARTLRFDSLPGYQFIGLYAYFNADGQILRLGANVDTCGDEAALQRLGAFDQNEYDFLQNSREHRQEGYVPMVKEPLVERVKVSADGQIIWDRPEAAEVEESLEMVETARTESGEETSSVITSTPITPTADVIVTPELDATVKS